MKNFLKLYQIEQKLFFRSADVFIFNLCMPVVTLIIIGLIAGSKAASVGVSVLSMRTEIIVLALIAAVCTIVSIKTFRWE